MLPDTLIETLLTMAVSFIVTIGCMVVFLFGYWLCSGLSSVRLGDGLPGAFDDLEQFRKDEEQALELMDERSRESYLAAKRWIEQNPPRTLNTEITLSQYMMIQDAGVGAWEFPYEYGRQDIVVQNKTELEFGSTVACAQTNLPLPKQNEVYYWEVKIYGLPSDTKLAIGLATKPYPLFRLPGMHKYSVAYESTGIRRLNQPFQAPKYGRRMMPGDVVGVGYRPRTGSVFFTHNGKRFEDVVQGMRISMFPTIGASGPCDVVVNFGQAGFVFIEANVKKWGLAPAQGTMAPPPAYGDQQGSVLLVPSPQSTPHSPPPFSPSMEAPQGPSDAFAMTPLPPPYPASMRSNSSTRNNRGGSAAVVDDAQGAQYSPGESSESANMADGSHNAAGTAERGLEGPENLTTDNQSIACSAATAPAISFATGSGEASSNDLTRASPASPGPSGCVAVSEPPLRGADASAAGAASRSVQRPRKSLEAALAEAQREDAS